MWLFTVLGSAGVLGLVHACVLIQDYPCCHCGNACKTYYCIPVNVDVKMDLPEDGFLEGVKPPFPLWICLILTVHIHTCDQESPT